MIDDQYEDLLRHVLREGKIKDDRTGTGTISSFGDSLRYNLADGFPLVTTKNVPFRLVAAELLWFLTGETNIAPLVEQNVHIWDAWQRPYSLDREMVLVTRRRAVPSAPPESWSTGNAGYRSDLTAKLANTWVKMMRRCYNPEHHRYALYGGTGVTVHPRWHKLEAFAEDSQKLPHWRHKIADWDNFELDKDYYGSEQYGPETCVWLRSDENNLYTKTAQPVEVVDATGAVATYLTQSVAAAAIGMSTSSFSRFLTQGFPTILKGNNKRYLGWEIKEATLPDDRLPRLELIPDGELGPVYGKQWRSWDRGNGDGTTIDQIAEVINTIKTDPNSRRMLVSAWNVGELERMALAPCHAFFQFDVTGGKLSCQVYQRSADLFLGVPFNIASYALLTHMIAQQTNLRVGELIWIGGDCHIYSNHIEQVEEQLSRKPKPFPRLHLVPRPSIDDYRLEDMGTLGYDPHPAIKAPVAV